MSAHRIHHCARQCNVGTPRQAAGSVRMRKACDRRARICRYVLRLNGVKFVSRS